jgi:hypothetical protein
LTISYLPNAFRAFPITKLGCVNASSDDKSNNIACSQCGGDSLSYALNSSDYTKACKLIGSDGLTTAYCSQKENGNSPRIITSCYQGSFSADRPLQPSPCPALADNGNNVYCMVSENLKNNFENDY